MVKRLVKIVSILLILALLIAGMFLYSIYIAVDKITLSHEVLTSSKIPSSLNDTKIAFISDIKYNEFMNKERLTKMIATLNEAGADVVIFGGDIFSSPETIQVDSQTVKEITTILKSIKAPLGKFAVLGEEDLVNKDVKKMTTNILFDSDFEIITNSNVRIRKDDTASINLIGLDSELNGNPNPDKAMKKITTDSYNILVTHCPDTINESGLNSKYIDAMVAGHSLGGQIYIPLIGSLHSIKGAQSYYHGNYEINETQLFISNGLGTKGTDVRFLCPPEILIFRLQNGK